MTRSLPDNPELPATAPQPLRPRPTPSKADRLRRALWGVVALVLFRLSPLPFHSWRRMLLRVFGAEVGSRAAIYPSARIYAPWHLELAEGTTVGPGATLYNVDRISLGPRAVVSQGAHLCTASHDIRAPGFDLVTAPIVLEADVWVAAEAFVAPGVTLSEGAVAAARAVVTRPVAPRVMVAGNPARPIGERPEAVHNSLRGRVKD